MTKQTKRIRRNRIKNKTKKYLGGSKAKVFEKSQGIMDYIGNKLSTYTGETTNYLKEKGLRLIGLQTIKKDEPEEEKVDESTQKVDNKINEISDAASGLVSSASDATSGLFSGAKEIGSDVVEVFDKGSAAVIGQVNDVLDSPKVEDSISDAAEETAEIGEKLLDNFNEKLSSPELKEETKEAIENVADYTKIAVKAMDEPLNEAVDELNEAGTKAVSGAAAGLIKVGTDSLAAVPYLGAFVEMGKIVNDASKAIGDVSTAASDATTTVSKLVGETSINMDEGIDKLNDEKEEGLEKLGEKKKEAKQIANRTNKSIESFENPLGNEEKKGGGKTRRKFLKRKAKSKRVRFSV